MAAAAVTCTIMPVTNSSPNTCSTAPRPSAPNEPSWPARSSVDWSSPVASNVAPMVQVRIAVTTTGIIIVIEATSTAEPTVALGLNRMIRNAPS